jgi:putative DNA primase/helicase
VKFPGPTRHLASRGINIPPPATLRWLPRCWHREARQELPAMVAVVEHVERGIVGVHRTYIRSDGTTKGAFEPIKSSLGPIKGGAVRLGVPRPGEWLVIGEGIETTLAVMVACAMPGWAALSAGGIRSLILPPEATHLVICADHDASGVGQRAAHDAAVRWIAEGRRVRIALPPEPGTDFADMLLADVSATAEVRHVA